MAVSSVLDQECILLVVHLRLDDLVATGVVLASSPDVFVAVLVLLGMEMEVERLISESAVPLWLKVAKLPTCL